MGLAGGSGVVWSLDHVKMLDPRGDDNDDFSENKDIVAVYYNEGSYSVQFRVDLFGYEYGDDQWVDVVILLDYKQGGRRDGCPGSESYRAAIEWDDCIVVYGHASGDYFLSSGVKNNTKLVGLWANSDVQSFETSTLFPEEFQRGWRMNFEIYTAFEGRPYDSVQYVNSDMRVNSAKVVFINHGNQALSYTDVLRGRADDPEHSGFDDVMWAHAAHKSALWHDQEFVEWMKAGVNCGAWSVMTSAYSQHVMPFVHDDMNEWSVKYHKELLFNTFSRDSRAAWIPERCWEWPNDANTLDYIAPVWKKCGVDIVVLEERYHGTFAPNARKVYTVEGADELKVVFRDEVFIDAMHGGNRWMIKNKLLNLALSSDWEQLIVYADDWEQPAAVADWQYIMPSARDSYWWTMHYVGTHPWIQAISLWDVIGLWGWRGPYIHINHGTFGSIGGADGYGGVSPVYGRNAWYAHWASYVHPTQGGKDFGRTWTGAHAHVSSTCGLYNSLNSGEELCQAAWVVLMANLFETGWHDYLGGPISGWQLKLSTHIKNANVYADAAKWARRVSSGENVSTEVFLWDMDDDSTDEVCLRNNRIMAVFEMIGGRIQCMFTADPTGDVIIGNDAVYYSSTEGDYNDLAHIGGLSDVWDGVSDHQHELYTIHSMLNSPEKDLASVTLCNNWFCKTITLQINDPSAHVKYTRIDREARQRIDTPAYYKPTNDTGNEMVLYVKTGFTPGMPSLLMHGRKAVNVIWTPSSILIANRVSGTFGGIVLTEPESNCVHFSSQGSDTYIEWLEVRGSCLEFAFDIVSGHLPT
ncbi:glycoside hydrolase family 57 [Pelomyxa schiedti]|nr:glycoside hydrolase family 57 [Pelomyxa schiedti]